MKSRCVFLVATILLYTAVAAYAQPALAQVGADLGGDTSGRKLLEEIVVTASKREETFLEVPMSVTALAGERLDSKFVSGDTVLALSYAVPSVYAETSNGRNSPRLYMRGLGNPDFDQNASQPVSMVFDEIPMELPGLKAFPLFDLANVEVIRGPQGTIYGRNTTAGILKFNSKRPTQEFNGYAHASFGTYATANFDGAVGGALVPNELAMRVSVMSLNRDEWISNTYTNENDVIGALDEQAARLQLLWTPNDKVSTLLLYQARDYDSTGGTIFRANVLTKGSNELNSNYTRDEVFHNGGGNSRQTNESSGLNLYIDWELQNWKINSITSRHETEFVNRADVDGGVPGIGPGFILFDVDAGGHGDIEQFTQEIRVISDLPGPVKWQFGAFYFSDELIAESTQGVDPNTTVVIASNKFENTASALFGQASFPIGGSWNMTMGLRYSEDEKDYTPVDIPVAAEPAHLAGDHVSWDISAAYTATESSTVYARIANGFRAPSIQARDTAFGGQPSTAVEEEVLSYEVGYKGEFNDRLRLNLAAYYYVIDEMQMTAIGGSGNFLTLINADEGTGTGVELDFEWAVTENLSILGGVGYVDTSINDSTLAVDGCNTTSATFDRICTITDPLNSDGKAIIDGNHFQHIPDWTVSLDILYNRPIANGSEIFLYTDWKFKGETNEFLYESIEFVNDSQFEGGIKAGWRNAKRTIEVAAFGRNITDEQNLIGAIDFNNLTGYVNEPRIVGLETRWTF